MPTLEQKWMLCGAFIGILPSIFLLIAAPFWARVAKYRESARFFQRASSDRLTLRAFERGVQETMVAFNIVLERDDVSFATRRALLDRVRGHVLAEAGD